MSTLPEVLAALSHEGVDGERYAEDIRPRIELIFAIEQAGFRIVRADGMELTPDDWTTIHAAIREWEREQRAEKEEV